MLYECLLLATLLVALGAALIALDAIADGAFAEVEAVVDGDAESLVLYRDGAQVRAFLNICPHAGRRLDWAPGQFLKSRTFVLLYVAQSCVQTALAVPIYYVPLFFQFARSESTITSALRLLPLVLVNIVVVFANGALLPRFRYYMPWYLASGVFNTAGGALLFARLTPSVGNAEVYGYTVLLALGTGLAQQAAYSVASAKRLDQVADAIGFINSAQVGSVVVALTFAALVFQNVGFQKVKRALEGTGFRDEDVRAALGGAKSRAFESDALSQEVRDKVEHGIVEAIRWTFLLILIAGVVGLAASLLMKRERVFEKQEANANEKKGATKDVKEAS